MSLRLSALAALCLPALLWAAPPKAQGMDPKAFQAWLDSAAPTEAHAWLKAYLGSWTTHQKDWLPSGALWNEADGQATCRMLLGDRFLQEDYTTTLDGHPFHGLGLTGFDRQKNAYMMVWLDDFGTGVIPLEGKLDGTGHVLTLEAPLPAGAASTTAPRLRVTDTWWDKDHHALAWWGQGPAGQPVKLSEILYTRNL